MDLEYSVAAQPSLFQLPIIRILYSGPTLPVFFLVSGYVLSLKPLRQIHSHSWDQLHNNLASGVFQRGMKLFGPPLVSTIIVAFMVQLNLYSADYRSMPGIIPLRPEKHSNLARQFIDWFRVMSNELATPWNWDKSGPTYDSHLWSIPLQYQCSILLYVTLIGLSKLRARHRIAAAVFFASYSLWMHRWEIFVYIIGMAIAELDHPMPTEELAWNHKQAPPTRWVRLLAQEILWNLLFTTGLYISSYPRHASDNMYFFSLLYKFARGYRPWHALGAVILVFTLPRSRAMQYVFTNSFFLYLGDISFAIYLVHGPVLHVLGYKLVFALDTIIPGRDGTKYQLAFALVCLFIFSIVIWVADLFKRTVQKGCTNASEWIKSKLWQD
jgi:peptidoglycan/LPS O-acetylase OafA/YrhL